MMATEVLTGRSGNLGRHFPPHYIALKTRMEMPTAEMEGELARVTHPILSFTHLAGITTPQDCDADPEAAHLANVIGPCKWFEAAARQGVRHFIFTSTSHVYGNPENKTPLSVRSPLKPVSNYGQQKLEAERALQELAPRFPMTKLTIARLFTVLSPAMKPGFLFTNLHRRARQKDFSPIRGLSYVRDFMPMDEAVRQLTTLGRWMEAPPVLNICSGNPTTVRELAARVFAEYGLSVEGIEEGPREPGDIDWLVGEPDSRFLDYLAKTRS